MGNPREVGVLLGGARILVPIARGKHLFPCRTQQLSLEAVTILGVHPWENSTVPNYRKNLLYGRFFLLSSDCHLDRSGEILSLPSSRTLHVIPNLIRDLLKWIRPSRSHPASFLVRQERSQRTDPPRSSPGASKRFSRAERMQASLTILHRMVRADFRLDSTESFSSSWELLQGDKQPGQRA